MTQQAGGHVSEREARAVAEAARETEWRKPSFAKELYLGRFRLDLIHPHPSSAAEDVAAHPAAVVGSGVRRSKLRLPGASLAALPNAEVLPGLGKPVEPRDA